jgi:hypothetical protein
MIKLSLITLVALLSLNISGQRIDKTFFLLGMMNKHNFNMTMNEEDIDKYVTDTLSQKFYRILLQLKNEKFKDQVIRKDSANGCVIYKNQIISKYFKSHFIPVNHVNIFNETLHGEMIDMKKFDDTVKVYSYLAGFYYRYGFKDSINYRLRLNMAFKNLDAVNYLLNKYSNGLVESRTCLSCIPGIVNIYFTLYCDDVKNETGNWVDKRLIINTQLLAKYLAVGKKL